MKGLRRGQRSKAAIEASIAVVLVEVQPLLRIDHCRIELLEYSRESGVLVLGIDGSCSDCEVSPATFSTAIEAHVKMRVPEVSEVRIGG